jgi:hypothetical protein
MIWIPVPVSAFLLTVMLGLEAYALWTGITRDSKRSYLVVMILPAFIVGGFLCFQMIQLHGHLTELRTATETRESFMLMQGSADGPWSFESVALLLAQLAAVLPVTTLSGAATYLYHRVSTSSEHSAGPVWYAAHLVLFGVLPVITWRVLYGIVNSIKAVNVHMTSFYVSLCLYAFIGIVSSTYYFWTVSAVRGKHRHSRGS